MMLILEGPDNVGKTTAAELFVKEMGDPWKIDHMSCPDEDFDYFSGYMERLADKTVHDRFHLGGLVYGKLLGLHPTPITPRTLGVVERYIRWRGALIVIMFDGDTEGFAQRLGEKNEMYDLNAICMANTIYRTLAWRGNHCHIWHDISRNGWPQVETVRFWMKKMEALRWKMP